MIWAASASAVALLTRNPWYLVLLTAAVLISQARRTGEALNWIGLRLYLSLLLFPALINLLMSRVGETVLLRLPIRWVGGPYTLEALLFGLTAGLQIASLVAVISVFSRQVSAIDLLRRMPPGLYPAGLSASIGLNFAPQARRGFAAIQEAMQVRGRPPRGWRDLPGLVTPLVVLSLESALALAEGMVARGWGGDGPAGIRRWLVPLGWGALACGLVLWVLAPGQPLVNATLTLVGLLALWTGLRCKGSGGRYRPEAWHSGDTWMVGVAVGVGICFVFLSIAAPSILAYYPYPRAVWPAFEVALAAGLVVLAIPPWMKGHND
jgi:energy-coupling factor transport system permease protein